MTTVYTALSEHQVEQDWDKKELFRELHRWAAIFDSRFKLEIPQIAICVDRFGRRLGHFRAGPNGFGLSSEIAINQNYLGKGPFWDVLGTLLHEQLHAWQEVHGKPGRGNYHNKEFRLKADSLGLVVDSSGVTQYRQPSPFTEVLERYGIKVPKLAAITPPRPALRGTSKLKLWYCGCTRVRVAVARFKALCLNCNREFKRVDS